MKIFKRGIFVVLMAFAVTITSCSKDDDNGPGGGDSVGTLTAKINGENYRSLPEEAEAFLYIIEDQRTLAIAGRDAQGREIGVSVNNFSGTGTYNIFDMDGDLGLGMYFEGDGDATQGWLLPVEGEAPGKLVVTDYSAGNRIKGTFHFTVMNPSNNSIKRITDGVFDVRVDSN
ncbi:hypothetical protein EI546_14400 [Aequorivita sp. H23M31]|uniref:Uncharacterized protein n=1 Tax=Aequorivita ciconiae TaxID=2494375 RepID=A0A410G6B5_9FLAO|nr:hypothetical protein [Aequorivita sp. H23M31]QAA82834.1 hypothetical protein EI546_14400 [Aequorivita sp. H23M31]